MLPGPAGGPAAARMHGPYPDVMQLPRSSAVADLTVLDSSASTNDALLARAATSEEFTVVATTNQTAGRGRLGRDWIAPPGQCLAASVLVKPRMPAGGMLDFSHWGWIPLMAGIAMTSSVAAQLSGHSPSLKWPNDVLVRGRKVCGILGELLPTGDGLVLGAGVNLSIPEAELPTPTSTSLGLEGALVTGDELADAILAGWIEAFRGLYTEFLRLGGDEEGSGIRSLALERCGTLGQQVRIELPGGGQITGVAIDIDHSGRICVQRETDGQIQAVAAGDVTHLRYE